MIRVKDAAKKSELANLSACGGVVINSLISSCCGKNKNEDVIPSEAGIQVEKLDSRLRGNDKIRYPQQILIN